MVEGKGLSEFRMGSFTMKDMIHMMTMMRIMDMMTKMTSECPIICSSNHIDTAPGLSCLKAEVICRP